MLNYNLFQVTFIKHSTAMMSHVLVTIYDCTITVLNFLPVCPLLYVQDTPSPYLTTEEPSFYCLTSSMSFPKRANFCCRNLGQLYRDRRTALNENEQHTTNQSHDIVSLL